MRPFPAPAYPRNRGAPATPRPAALSLVHVRPEGLIRNQLKKENGGPEGPPFPDV